MGSVPASGAGARALERASVWLEWCMGSFVCRVVMLHLFSVVLWGCYALGHHFGCSGLRFGRFIYAYFTSNCQRRAFVTLGNAVCSLIPRSSAPSVVVLSRALLVVFAMASWHSKLVEQGVQESVADVAITLGLTRWASCAPSLTTGPHTP